MAASDWVKGNLAVAWSWSILSSLILAMLLANIGLYVDLLISRGNLDVSASKAEALRLAQLAGDPLPIPGQAVKPAEKPEEASDGNESSATSNGGDPPAASSPRTPPVDDADVRYRLQTSDNGLLPVIWRLRDSRLVYPVSWLFRHFESLRSNAPAAMILLISGAFLIGTFTYCRRKVDHYCETSATQKCLGLRLRLHRQSLRLGPEDLDGSVKRHAIELFTTEVEQLQTTLGRMMRQVVGDVPILIITLVVAALIDVTLFLQWIIPVGFCAHLLERGRQRRHASERLGLDRANSEISHLADSLLQPRLIRSYDLEETVQNRFKQQLNEYASIRRTPIRAAEDPVWLERSISALCVGSLLFLLFVLSMRVFQRPDDITSIGLFLFVPTMGLGWWIARRLLDVSSRAKDVGLKVAPIWRYLDELPAVSQAVGAKFLQPLTRTLQFENITVGRPGDNPILDRLELRLAALRTYAVVSLNDAEVAALTMLLPRFIEPNSGRVLFDGEDISWGTLESLRAEVTIVSTDPPFFGSVAENIRAGRKEITTQQVMDAAKLTHAHQFIVNLPQGYETVLTGRGDGLNAGQLFLLNLTRAVLHDPALLIVEEPAGALSDDHKALIDDAYHRIFPGRTVMIVPQRLSTLKRVDEIIVLREGRVDSAAPHASLVQSSAVYRHWEYMHFHEFRELKP